MQLYRKIVLLVGMAFSVNLGAADAQYAEIASPTSDDDLVRFAIIAATLSPNSCD